MNPKTINRFILFSQITLVFVFLVIIAGAVVRATGSGMGCPDWPKCFGTWIPPTDVSQLPKNYKEIYAGEHHAVTEFNALNTWTEYANRLVGAILGILIFIQLLLSRVFRKTDKRIFVLSLMEFLLIGFQGWLGAKVVSSNLAPAKITTHMIMALVILSIAIIIIHRAKKLLNNSNETNSSPTIKRLAIVVLILSFIQVMLGTQVRESVDVLLKNFDAIFRNQIVEHLGIPFKIHRSFSLLILLFNSWMIYEIIKGNTTDSLKKLGKGLGILLITEILVGIVLSRFALPGALQPTHLLIACVIYATQFLIVLRVWKK
jgi:cytochrome c oxidase assembly protein subunit 15